MSFPRYSVLYLLLSVIYLSLVSGCTTTGLSHSKSMRGDTVLVSRGIIRNLSKYEISDVEVLHLPTRVVAGVSTILPNLSAEMGISPRELKAESAILSWREQGQRYQVDLMLPEMPTGSGSRQYWIVYQISQGGEAAVSLVPDR